MKRGAYPKRQFVRPFRQPAYTLFLIFLINLVLISPARAAEITVSAAASLKDAFQELGKIFETRQKGTEVQFNFGASGDLARQIVGGAPVDVFASAGVKEMDELEQQGLTAVASRINFAGNAVVLAVPAAATVAVESFPDLARKEVKKIAIGNPAAVPAGRYAEQVLKKLNLWEPLKDKLVFAGNVRQVLDYVIRNEVDAGLVFATDAAARRKELKKVLPAPEVGQVPIVYPIAAVKGGKNEAGARMFIALVSSKEGKRVLGRYGFKSLDEKSNR